MKYISKIDSGSTRCYFVRPPSFKNGKPLHLKKHPTSKSFAVGSGTWKQAFKKAVIWLEEYLELHNAIDYLNSNRPSCKGPMRFTGRTKSGVIGVHRGGTWKECGFFPAWVANIQTNSVPSQKNYSVNLYGEEMAFRSACIYRFKHHGVLVVTDTSKLPCRPPVDWYGVETGRLHKRCPPELKDIYDSISSEGILDEL